MKEVILNVHGVGSPTRKIDCSEEPYWISEEMFREILTLSEESATAAKCHFTIDDGNLSDVTITGPTFAKYNVRAEIFILSGRIGQLGSLDAHAILDLQQMGHTIGTHGCDHLNWARLDETTLYREIRESRDTISDITGTEIDSAGIPFGRYNKRVLKALRRSGIRRCYSSDGGAFLPGDYPLPRFSLRNDMKISDIQAFLNQPERWQTEFVRRAKMTVKKLL